MPELSPSVGFDYYNNDTGLRVTVFGSAPDEVQFAPALNELGSGKGRVTKTTWKAFLDSHTRSDDAAPANTVEPTITGTAQEGETLTGTAGTWTGVPTPTLTYQWLADDVEIEGETGLTYDVVTADVGAVITFAVTGTSSSGSSTATSDPTEAVIGA